MPRILAFPCPPSAHLLFLVLLMLSILLHIMLEVRLSSSLLRDLADLPLLHMLPGVAGQQV